MTRATRPLQMRDALGHVLPYSITDSKLKIVYGTDTLRWYGIARANTDIGASAWRIYQETVNTSGNTVAIDYANGSNDYDNIWDDSVALVINAVTQADPSQVTTTTDHGFVTGDIINIEEIVGMEELNNNNYTITKIDATKFTLGVDTSGYTAYTSDGTAYKRTYANYDFS